MRDLDAVERRPGRRLRAHAIGALAVAVVSAIAFRAYASDQQPSPVPAPAPQPTASTLPTPVLGLQFVSPRVGYVAIYDGEPAHVYRTLDAGRT